MINWILEKISWNQNDKELQKLQKIADKINAIYENMMEWSDNEVKAKTQEFKNRLEKGETLDDITYEAFAVVKQACRRMVGHTFTVKWEQVEWNMIPYDVQLMWWVILHKWTIAEMKTWEWKTLVASLPTYLNALSGKWVHVITVNDYLADRDAQWMKPLYERLGLSIWTVVKWVAISERRAEYEKDITYVENSELGFDFLRDNLVKAINERVLTRRPLNYAIIDEVDSILIDEARTPLIISEPDQTPTDKYEHYGKIVKLLQPSKFKKKVSKGFLHEMINDIKNVEEEVDTWHYHIDEKTKTASLSTLWIQKLEEILWVKNIYQELWYDEIHHIENALKAQAVYEEDKDYLISAWEILIIDQNTGRAMPWRRFSQWLHQAIEAKHGVEIQKESKTLATITYQNFFKLYNKLSWMTGTAATEGEEFDNIYELWVLIAPTNKPILRVDLDDKVYFDQKAKRDHIVEHVKFAHNIWQPILIGTSAIATSEYISNILQKNHLTHSVLNAKMHEQEAHIVSNAWKFKSVMVATNMAWRWTDIKLEKWLNQKLATNYADWIHSALNGKLMDQDWPNSLSINVYSNLEYDRTIEAIMIKFWLSEEEITKSSKWWHTNSENISIKINFNTKKKKPNQVYAEINIKPGGSEWIETIQKNFHYGLCILGTEKHDSRRIDNQLRWRAGRQWDPWISVFYVALDDQIMRKMGWEKIQAIAWLMLSKEDREKLELTQSQFTNAIVRSQKQMEGRYFSMRKHLFDYDSVINKQRIKIYEKRDQMLFALDKMQTEEKMNNENNPVIKEIVSFIDEVVKNFINTQIALQTPPTEMIEILKKEFNLDLAENFFDNDTYETLHIHLKEYITNKIITLEKEIDNKLWLNTVLTRTYLNIIDRNWIEHIDNMSQLRDKVWLMWYAKLDPLVEYKKEAYEKFQSLLENIKLATLVTVMNTDFSRLQDKPVLVIDHNNESNNIMWMIKNVANSIKLPNWKTIEIDKDNQQHTNFDTNNILYQDEDWTEVFQIDDNWSNKENWVVFDTKSKLRPNDKVTVRYTNWKMEYDVKYKKVKSDIDNWNCKIIW